MAARAAPNSQKGDSNMSEEQNRRAAVDADLGRKIDKFGWAVVGVFPAEDDPGVPFAYTVGLSAKGLPELALYGLGSPVAGAILNDVARGMVTADSAVRGGDQLRGLLAGDLPIGVLEMTNTTDLTGVCRMYGAVSAAVQLVWPDKAGLMPWDEGYAIPADRQPLHGSPPVDAPYSAARMMISSVGELADLLEEAPPPTKLDLSDEPDGIRRDNNTRARWGGQALVAYARQLRSPLPETEVETAVSDLVGDLRHLFDALGLDWDDAVGRAERYHQDEITGTK